MHQTLQEKIYLIDVIDHNSKIFGSSGQFCAIIRELDIDHFVGMVTNDLSAL